ncbi:DUF983 domain-containing protein [Skermanella pratensis]|uniref:DUF983 domain-containing protein n=1 Tax=Skermanella pratensis TaxID=2233999 RepID=UPI0013014310|nr:DUF983 domain-containing protein [Skermanella pratensis]
MDEPPQMQRSRELEPPPGSFLTGLLRGIRRRCPGCGRSHLFSRYVTVVPNCPDCGLETSAYRADDAPPYFTIFVVGHVVIPGMLLLERNFHPEPWVHMVTWVPMTLLLTLALLPPIKGAVIGAQWALRMKS